MNDCLISFGSNLGQSIQIIREAVETIEKLDGVEDLLISTAYRTRAIGGPTGQNDFVNGVLRLKTPDSPTKLLTKLRTVEQDFGRKRRIRWDARSLDLDLILHNNHIVKDDLCEVPHPRMSFRPFVLVPAVEVAADWIHPVIGRSLSELLQALQTRVARFVTPECERFGEDDSVLDLMPDRSLLHKIESSQNLESEAAQLLVLFHEGSTVDQIRHDAADWIESHSGPLLICRKGDPVALGTELQAARSAIDDLPNLVALDSFHSSSEKRTP